MTPLVPNLVGSDEQYARYHHDDLPVLDEVVLEGEFLRLTTLLAWRPTRLTSFDLDWLLERRGRLKAELQRRRTSVVHSGPRSRPLLARGRRVA